jgi:prepilin-type N-terminal cleavage/methylation domain-containing protein
MFSRKRRRVTAFTLVELLVVIAIIGALVALLLPAVQAAREGARRMQCSNQLRQLGLACHNFADTRGCIPPTRTASGGFPPLAIPANAYNGWVCWLLPYIEQSNLAANYNPQLHFAHANNRMAIQAQVKLFYCPSTPVKNRAIDFAVSSGGLNVTVTAAAAVDYSVIRQVSSGLWQGFPNDVDTYTDFSTAGVGLSATNLSAFSYNSSNNIRIMRWASVADGTSNTLLYVEIRAATTYIRPVGNAPAPRALGPGPIRKMNLDSMAALRPTILGRDAIRLTAATMARPTRFTRRGSTLVCATGRCGLLAAPYRFEHLLASSHRKGARRLANSDWIAATR